MRTCYDITVNVVAISGCACSDEILMYKCSVVDGVGGVTFWYGTAFDCPNSDNEVALLHYHFFYGRSCNNGTIVATGFSIEGKNYTSQLNVTVTPEKAGKTIMCAYDNGINSTIHLSTVIPILGLSPCMQTKLRSNSCLMTTITLQAHFYLPAIFG